MKVRNGFVSNSSSSSFVIMLPKNIDVDKVVEERYDELDKYVIGNIYEEYDIEEEDETKIKGIIKEISLKFIKEGYVYENYMELSLIPQIFDDYVIAVVDGGPDDGGVELLSDSYIEKIEKILGCDKLKKEE